MERDEDNRNGLYCSITYGYDAPLRIVDKENKSKVARERHDVDLEMKRRDARCIKSIADNEKKPRRRICEKF
jgi:hypothetical protein